MGTVCLQNKLCRNLRLNFPPLLASRYASKDHHHHHHCWRWMLMYIRRTHVEHRVWLVEWKVNRKDHWRSVPGYVWHASQYFTVFFCCSVSINLLRTSLILIIGDTKRNVHGSEQNSHGSTIFVRLLTLTYSIFKHCAFLISIQRWELFRDAFH